MPIRGLATKELTTESAAQTEELGSQIASKLRAGDVVLLKGELGTGKSTFVRGACRGLGVSELVTSPSFVLGNLYEADKVKVAHLDLYRLNSIAGEDPSLLDDYVNQETISFVEWPQAAEDEIDSVKAEVLLVHGGRDRRSVTINYSGLDLDDYPRL